MTPQKMNDQQNCGLLKRLPHKRLAAHKICESQNDRFTQGLADIMSGSQND
jgi:hypothetical protein